MGRWVWGHAVGGLEHRENMGFTAALEHRESELGDIEIGRDMGIGYIRGILRDIRACGHRT